VTKCALRILSHNHIYPASAAGASIQPEQGGS
jgi:hypothetical protein